MGTVTPGNYAGRYIHYGIREHGMAAAMTGIALHAASSRTVAPSWCSPTTCARRCAWPPSCASASSTCSPTTASASARTDPPPADRAPGQPARHARHAAVPPADAIETRSVGTRNPPRRRPSLLHSRAKACRHCAPTRRKTAARAAATCWPKPTARASHFDRSAARSPSPWPRAICSPPRASRSRSFAALLGLFSRR